MIIIPPVLHAGTAGKPGSQFTGDVFPYVTMASTDGVIINTVNFTPCARTYWHSHEHGQILIVLAGRGLIQAEEGPVRVMRAGDTIWAPPGERHWHGASPESFVTHTAISLGVTSWAEEVSEASYAAYGDRRGEVVPANETRQERFERGLAIRRDVLGAEHVDRSLAEVSEFSRPVQELVTEYCWGVVWDREGLERKTRSLLNLAMLTALNRPHEFGVHVRGALTNGATVGEIQETLLQTAIYVGVPAALESFRLAEAVFKEIEQSA